ncbi:unnamed protein product [Lymnaea stagnalis]|uniref:Protein phosphatase 1E n=1 Tax=Lymnaea stagnalis TaxID=6523 RepID=A0AAV2HYB3_LYMST
MEDKHVVIRDLNALYNLKDSPPQSYFAIFDGHGGVDAAMYAATHLHGHLVSDKLFHVDPATAMKHAYKTTDIKFLEKAKRENLRSGTTGISVLIRGSDLYLGWLGDSQAVLVCAGRPAQIMEPHKPEREDEKRRIEDLGGSVLFIGVWRVNGNISVSRAIGDATHKPFISSDADVKSIKLTGEEQFLVIACDGLWDVLTPAQVTQIVYDHVHSSPDGLDDVASLLVKAARDSGSSDNISVIVVFFQTSLTDPESVTDSSCLLNVTEHSDSAKDRSTKSTSVDPVVPKPTLSANEKVKTKNYKMGQSQTRSKGSIMKSISLYLSSAAHCWHS